MMEPRTPQEVALPVSVLASLQRHMADEAGQAAAEHVLRSVGAEYGRTLAGSLQGSGTASRFWAELRRHFEERGWGTLDHERPHAALGLLASEDWAESRSPAAGHRSCVFSAGVLSGLLSQVAGRPVVVLEAACRGRGDDRCAFAFGSEAAVRKLEGALKREGDLGQALTKLEP